MKTRAKLASAVVAAGLAVAAQSVTAQAITFNPSTSSIDFGNVLVGTQSIYDLFFNADASVPLGTATTPSASPTPPFSGVNPFANCGGTSCLVKIIFAPLTTGSFIGEAQVLIQYSATQNVSFTVPLQGVGVVPIPGALPLFLTGLGGLAYMARPRRKTVTA